MNMLFKSSFFLVLLSLAFGCSRKESTTFQGVALDMPYKVEIAKALSREEKNYVRQILSSCFAEVNQISNHWNPVSEISLFNRSKSTDPTTVSPYLQRLLEVANQIVYLSKERYDPTLRPLIQLWKSSMGAQRAPSPKEIYPFKQSIGWNRVKLENGLLKKDVAEIAFDLDAIAKGMAVDVIAEKLLFAGYKDYLVEWAGEIRCSGKQSADRPWRIEIYSPSERPSNIIELSDEAIATSGNYMQYWAIFYEGKTRFFSHLMNKKKLQPIEIGESSTISVTVKAPSCVLADGLATAAMLCETPEELQAWIKEVKEIYPTVTFWVVGRHEW